MTALHYAAKKDSSELASYLLQAMADPNQQNSVSLSYVRTVSLYVKSDLNLT
jgi:ankyrin repeat protein